MLKGIDPLLTPELLKALAEMGHGDEIVVADANFTAATLGPGKTVIHLPGVGVQRVCEAVPSLLPLVSSTTPPARAHTLWNDAWSMSWKKRPLASVRTPCPSTNEAYSTPPRFSACMSRCRASSSSGADKCSRVAQAQMPS